jgi:hypothetical protein
MTAKRLFLYLVIAVFSLVFASAGLSAGEEVSGTVTKDDLIVVQKGKAKWEISRGKDTKGTGDLKVGSKVTIEYKMNAATVEVKEEKAKEKKK